MNVNFLTPIENEVMEHLRKAQELFDELCVLEPQDPSDSYNFGHYVDAAKNAVVIRGARRMDPDNLLPKRNAKQSEV